MGNKQIPVLSQDLKSLHWLELSDICFTAIEGRSLAYYTIDTVYYHIRTLEELLIALQPEGFEKLDRVNLVCMNNITYYDSEYGKVFFDEVIDNQSIYTTVSSSYMRKVKIKLGKEKDISFGRKS